MVAEDVTLVISRCLRAPRAAVWQAWADPEQLKLWWCPKPWTTEVLGFDLVPGGSFHTLMRGPDGGTSDNPGAFLDVVPLTRLAWTTSLLAGWRPAPEPWMPLTAFITFEDEGQDTRYTATVLHKDAAGRLQHEEMGFYEGWGTCIDQLEALARHLS
ncbi:MAG TPA: polyketide cyclase [Propionibacteriaceae bacterium]|nr:SRPBCC family protein [Micropruina sp.]HBX81907.1 polyketide cyclase [Propionibacteriaceae bacterium]HBY24411.1 polyketide cyclase [Propionibacteriaceae bacterium]